jgi:hypothetical protein
MRKFTTFARDFDSECEVKAASPASVIGAANCDCAWMSVPEGDPATEFTHLFGRAPEEMVFGEIRRTYLDVRSWWMGLFVSWRETSVFNR